MRMDTIVGIQGGIFYLNSSIPGSGRSPGEGNGTSLQYSGLENPMDRGAWWATVHGVTKSWTQLSDFTFHIYTSIYILGDYTHQVEVNSFYEH